MATHVTQAEPDQDQHDDTDDAYHHDDAADRDREPEIFPREYVRQLRQEAAEHRVKAKRADGPHDALVTADGRLGDFTDLPSDYALSPFGRRWGMARACHAARSGMPIKWFSA